MNRHVRLAAWHNNERDADGATFIKPGAKIRMDRFRCADLY